MMRLPLAVDLLSRNGSLAKDGKIRNGIVSADGDVLKRPGAEVKKTGIGSTVQGVVMFSSIVIASGDTLYFVDSGYNITGSVAIA